MNRPQYDGAHRRAVKAAWSVWTPGDLCPRCQHPTELGDRLDLDHADDGGGYLGLSHSSPCRTCGQRCNQRAGGIKAALAGGKRLRQRECQVCGLPYTATSGRSGARQETCGATQCRATLTQARRDYTALEPPPAHTGRVW